MNILVVAVGGAIGATLRYTVIRFFVYLNVISFPYGTLVVNIVGSFLIGFLAFLLVNRYLHNETVRLFLIVGVLGAFTTFSSFSLDTLHLFLQHRYFSAILYILSSVILCIIAAFLGMLAVKLGR